MKRTSATFDERSWSPSAAPMSTGPKADSADLQPVASEKSPIRPDHSHWLAGGYSQKLGGKFAQGFCDATLKGYVGQELTVIAWLWARTIQCPNPSCRARAPLVRSFWL